ncbi:MAG: hypothetical protein PHN68_01725 [Prolixibacteraceae bacterium]|nr:hypothetical protein [Prolixibacteraceae bacterium]
MQKVKYNKEVETRNGVKQILLGSNEEFEESFNSIKEAVSIWFSLFFIK